LAVFYANGPVLFEDGTKHSLDDDTRGRVGDEGGFLMELLSKDVNTKVAILACGSIRRDAQDEAGMALDYNEVTYADMVTWNSEGSRRMGLNSIHGTRSCPACGISHGFGTTGMD
jgi:enolase